MTQEVREIRRHCDKVGVNNTPVKSASLGLKQTSGVFFSFLCFFDRFFFCGGGGGRRGVVVVVWGGGGVNTESTRR